MASFLYNDGKVAITDGTVDLDSDIIKCALVTSTYTPDKDTHDFFDDVTNEISGTGYTAGGATLANADVTADDTNDRAKFDADDVTWSSATITARAAIIYKSTGTASTSNLIAYIDFTNDKTSTGADFVITWHTDGIFYLGE